MAFLIAGLGNPGEKYVYTRHNIGFLTIDELAGSNVFKSGFKGEYTEKMAGGEKVYLLKPQTYMNLSGESVFSLASYFKIPQENILIIHDELDFAFGTMKIRQGGSSAGHNGVSSVTSCVGQSYYRLRMGIAGIERGKIRGYTAQYVLAEFTRPEKEHLQDFVEKAAQASLCFVEQGPQKAMGIYNKN